MTILTDKYYQVTDVTGKTWKEWLSKSTVSQYESWGWTVEEIQE